MEIRRVKTKSDLSRFIEFPYHLYRMDRFWVPPLRRDVRFILSDRNPFWEHTDRELFIAESKGRIVGRICAILDRNYVSIHNEKCGFFGFFECEDDYTVSEMLFSEVTQTLKRWGMEKMRGPVNPSMNEECGFLLEGWDSPPFIMMTYTPRYYLELSERWGMKKAKDLFAFIVDVPDEIPEKMTRVSQLIKKRNPDISVRPVDLRYFRREVNYIKEIYNNAWEKNWGFVPMTDSEIEDMAKRLKSLVVPDLVLLAFDREKPVGVILTIPNYNEILKRLNGKLGPIEIAKFLYYKKRIEGLRLMILGVLEGYRKRGIESLLYIQSIIAAKRLGFKRAEFSWVLEDNYPVHQAAYTMNAKLYKKYRIYEKEL